MVYNPIDSNTTIKVLNTEMANLKKSIASSISAENTKIAELQNQINNLSNTTPSGTSSLTTRQFSKQVTVSAGGYAGVSFTDVEVQGYKPVGLIGVAVTGSNNTKINQYRWSAKSSDADYPYVGVQNYGSSNATVTVTITALYYANDSVIYGERGLKGEKGDDYVLTNSDKQEIASMVQVGDNATVSKFTSEWVSDTTVYTYGTLLIYSDYMTIGNADGTTETVPAFKVGDGTHKASELPFTSAENVRKLGHSITIGTYIFDGSQDIVIPVYAGESEVS